MAIDHALNTLGPLLCACGSNADTCVPIATSIGYLLKFVKAGNKATRRGVECDRMYRLKFLKLQFKWANFLLKSKHASPKAKADAERCLRRLVNMKVSPPRE